MLPSLRSFENGQSKIGKLYNYVENRIYTSNIPIFVSEGLYLDIYFLIFQ